jgi:hypothetical protein
LIIGEADKMSSLESILKQLESKDALNHLSKSVNAKPKQVKDAAKLSLTTLAEALNRNTNNQKGADALSTALEKHKNSDTSNVTEFLKNVDKEDGAKIVNHVLGDKSQAVKSGIAEKTGLNISQIGGLLVQFAPLILGFLGNKKKQGNLDSAGVSGLTSTLSGALGQGKGSGILGIASSLLGSGSGGNILSDIGNLLGK